MHNFKDLRVWQKSIDLTTEISAMLAFFPSDEKFGLVSQMKRAAVQFLQTSPKGPEETLIKNSSIFYPSAWAPYLK
jgi:hypothetical protein